MNTAKIEQKLPFQPNITFFSNKHPEELYIIVYIKLYIGNDMDKFHYVCDLFYYNREHGGIVIMKQ